MYGYVYETTNLINGKKYIGQHKYDPIDKRVYKGSGTILRRAFNKYGFDNFETKIIESCETKESLNEAEKYWIKYYDATNSDEYYNISSGGDGGNTIAGYSEKQLLEYKKKKSEIHKKTSLKGEDCYGAKLTNGDIDNIIQLLLEGEYSDVIANQFEISTRTIDDIRNHVTWKHKTANIVFPKVKKRTGLYKRAVVQYDIDGNQLGVFDSGKDAEKKTGISRKTISSVCHGTKRTANGYVWRLLGDDFYLYDINKYDNCEVKQYDLDGNYIRTFKNIRDASKSLDNIKDAISTRDYIIGKAIRSTCDNTCYGYAWKSY